MLLPFLLPSLTISVFEAEDAVIINSTIETSLPHYSGTGYVYMRDSTESITWTVPMTDPGDYDLHVRYATSGGTLKKQYLSLNGVSHGELTFPGSTDFTTTIAAQKLRFTSGANTVRISASWGWQLFDWISVTPYSAVPFRIPPGPVTTGSTASATTLYYFLRTRFQNAMLSGVMTVQGDGRFAESDWVSNATGHSPALVGLDFMHQVGKNTAWYTSDPALRKCVVDDAESYWRRGGIPAICWHWRDPLQDTDSFYSPASGNAPTHFDAARAASPGTAEYRAVIRDMDVIAAELLDLQARGVAALWRPFHEAAGGWFWWGFRGKEAVKKLWRLMYERFVNYHGIRNLVWVWTAEPSDDAADWFPGGDVVDVVGVDIYADVGDHGAQSAAFEKVRTVFAGAKIIALSECGSAPDAEESWEVGATWSFFMTWYREFTIPTGEKPYNTVEFWRKQMEAKVVIGIDRMPGWE